MKSVSSKMKQFECKKCHCIFEVKTDEIPNDGICDLCREMIEQNNKGEILKWL